jgi:hypothetical protein
MWSAVTNRVSVVPVTDTGTLGTAAAPELDEDVVLEDEDAAPDEEDVVLDDEGAPPVPEPDPEEHAEDAAMAAGATRMAACNVDRTRRARSSMATSLGARGPKGCPMKVRRTARIAKSGALW